MLNVVAKSGAANSAPIGAERPAPGCDSSLSFLGGDKKVYATNLIREWQAQLLHLEGLQGSSCKSHQDQLFRLLNHAQVPPWELKKNHVSSYLESRQDPRTQSYLAPAMPRSPSRIDRARLSPDWPTALFPAPFWEQLGRTVATFGLLEEVLGKAIFAFTATTEFNEKDAAEYLAKWDKQLHQALTDTLWPLAEVYGKVVREHQESEFENVDELVEDIKKASKIRNALCHGSWHAPDASGATDLYYFDKKDGKFDTRIDIEWLRRVHA